MAMTSFAQVQTDRLSASTARSFGRSGSVQSSGRGSITPTSSLDGDMLLLDTPTDGVTLRNKGAGSRPTSRPTSRGDASISSSGLGTAVGAPGLSFRKLARNSNRGGELAFGMEDIVFAKRGARERFSSAVSRGSSEDDRMSRGGRGRQSKRATRVFLQTPKTHRGVWASADFQYYISKMEPQALETSEWANLGYRSARHYRPRRLSQTDDEVLTSLQIFTGDDNSLSKAYSMKDTLRRLDAHKCGIQDIPEQLPGILHRLERLDLSCNSLSESSFPPSFKGLSSLIEINLNSNLLTSLPPAFSALHRLQRLYLGFNEFTQIPSLEGLRQLTSLDLECNNLTVIPWQDLASSCKRLHVLNLQSNQIAVIDKSIKFLRELVQLNVAHNQLSTLPVEVFQLKKLQNMDASHNEIIRLPQYNLSQQAQHMIDLLDLSFNNIYKFSDWLLFVSWCIDLSGNKIQTILGAAIKHMDYETAQRLVLRENPIISPPMEVCMAGLPAIIKYFQEIKTHSNVYQGLKLIVLGTKSCGKTSLVQSLSDSQSRLTLSDEDTVMCDISSIELKTQSIEGEDKPFRLSVWDFSGDQFYMNTVNHFLDSNALYVLTFNLATYRTGDFHKNFASWLDYVVAKNNEVKLMIVGTHADLLNSETVKRICNEVDNLIAQHLQVFKDNIQKKISAIEKLENIGAYMQEQLKHYVGTLMNVKTYIHGKPLAVSSASFTGFEELAAAITGLASNTELFPNGLRQIPSLWVGVHDTVETVAKQLKVPILHIEEFKEKLIANHGMKNMMTDICTYLHDSGTVIWLHESNKLKDFVFLRPRWLIDIIKTLVRHDIKKLEYDEIEDILIPRAVLRSRFLSLRKEVSEAGCYDSEFLKMLISRDVPSDSTKLPLLVQILCSVFEYGYPIERDISESEGHFKLNTAFEFSNYEPPPTKQRPQSASMMSTIEQTTTLPNLEFDANATELLSKTPKLIGILLRQAENEVQAYLTSLVRGSDGSGSSVGDGGIDEVPCVLMPCIRQAHKPDYVDRTMESLKSNEYFHLAAVFVFPVYTPPGLFSRIVVRLNQPHLNLQYLSHWTNGFYATHKTNKIAYTVQSWEEKSRTKDGVSCVRTHVRMEACKEEKIDFKAVQEMWGDFLPLLMDTEDLIAQYKGLRVERFMECPYCGSPSFNGEWPAPKDMQHAMTDECSICKKDVKTELLIQPRERKAAEQLWKVIVELRRRRKMRAEANKPPTVLRENKMKKVLSAFGPPKLSPAVSKPPPGPANVTQSLSGVTE